MIVLDTHALIWLIEGDERLGKRTRRLIDRDCRDGGVLVPAISLWETAMLVDRNKIALSRAPRQWFEKVLSTPGFTVSAINPAIGVDAGSLPGDIHGDPADRLIVATARFHGCAVATADGKILAYADAGHVHAIDARR